MSDNMKIPPEVHRSWAEAALHEMFVEFLRAVSREDAGGCEHLVAGKFWKAISEMQEAPSAPHGKIVADAFRGAISRARYNPKDPYELEGAANEIATASAKVLAERISKNGLQMSHAKSRMLRSVRDYEKTRTEIWGQHK